MDENVLARHGPSDRVRSMLETATSQILQRTGGRGLVALAVVGSAARGEETWQGERLVGDIDLAAVVRWPDPWTRRRFEHAARGLPDSVGLGCFPLYSLSRYRTLEFYEAKRTAWVLWGQPNIFDRVRIDTAQDIPRWEGLRLLLNRAVDCLRARAGLMPEWYAAVKVFLALGEADLVFADRYVPSYRDRLRMAETLGGVVGSCALLDRLRWATHLKLGEEPLPVEFSSHEHERWLLAGIASLTSRYLGQTVSPTTGLELLGKDIKHPEHRAFYIAQHLGRLRRCARALGQDPVFVIWRRTLEILGGSPATEQEQRDLLAEFEQVLQPLPR